MKWAGSMGVSSGVVVASEVNKIVKLSQQKLYKKI